MASEFMQKYWWKNLMHKVQSWGASVVLVGALFKITHWPGATVMLTVGLLTEAVIFFLAGVEAPHEEIDWTLVYPELKLGEKDEEDLLTTTTGVTKGRKGTVSGSASVDSISKLDEMIEKAGKDGLFDKLSQGFTSLNENVAKLNDITDATVATKEFSDNLKTASGNVNGLSEAYKNTTKEFTGISGELHNSIKNSAQTITYSFDGLSDSINKTKETVSKHNDTLDKTYKNLITSMDLDFSKLGEGNKEYNEKIGSLNKNLTAVNAIFEMQLEEANLDQMVKDIQESSVYAKKYSEEITKLSKNLNALNDVYGKMLSALNVKLD